MLQYMRNNANSTVVWLIIGAIAVVFIFFGVGGQGANKMITVNGEEASVYEYSRLVDEFSRNMPGDSSPDTALVAKKAAAFQVVNRMLALQFGRGLGLEPSDRAVAQKIAETPEFQVDGRFDKTIYLDLLEAGRIKPSAYENDIRSGLLAERSSEMVLLLSRAYRPEVMEKYHFEQDQMEFGYVFFPSSVYREGLTPSESQLTEYYARTMGNWRRPAAMKVEYVELKPADFVDQAQVSQTELEEYYHDNSQRFTHQETADVSHILIRFPQMNPSQADKDQTLEEARAVYERAKTEDFAALAQEMSQDPGTASNGGVLGSIGRGMTFDSFEQAAFSSPIGEVSQPVETSVGYHIIKVTGRRSAGVSPLEEIKDTLIKEIKTFKSKEMAVAKLEDLINRAETSKLADAAASIGLKTEVSDTFTEANPPAFFGNDAAEVKKAFSATLGKAADAVEKEDRLVIYEPIERQESFIPGLEEIKAEVTEAWIADQALSRSRTAASNFLSKSGEKGWSQALAEESAHTGFITGQSGLASRQQMTVTAPLDQSDEMQMRAAVHSVGQVGEIVPTPVRGELDGQAGTFVLTLARIEKADDSVFDGPLGEYETLMKSMEKANLMYEIWQLSLFEISKDKIVVPSEYLE